ncbi:MAG: hypothetical protein IKP65_04740 [Alphaproteobacteria bacterium]|nr:hypothetical protein [Alphaproteobacteria bacterium]
MKKEMTVLTEQKIKQKMAGYKSAYSKRIKAATNSKERSKLMKERDSFLASKEKEILDLNRKAVQVRAGKLSWVTRRKNEASKKTAIHSTKPCTSKKVNVKKVRIVCK